MTRPEAPHPALLLAALAAAAGCGADAPGPADGDTDGAGTTTTIVIRNPGPGPAYLDGSYREWCATVLLLHRTGTGDRLWLPTVARCRCDDCGATACLGMVSWTHFVLELPEGSAIRYAWDRRHLAADPSRSCSGVGCLVSAAAPAGELEVRVPYGRTTPVCLRGEVAPTDSMIVPSGFELPPDVVQHQCAPEDSNNCATIALETRTRFDRDDAEVEVVLAD